MTGLMLHPMKGNLGDVHSPKDMPDCAARMMDFSIVICTRNRAQDLAATLRSLIRLQIPEGCRGEVVVVDNGSTDQTTKVIAEAQLFLPLPLISTMEPERGLGVARNRGLGLARGKFLIWTDDDVRPARSWLREIIAAFEADEQLDLLGGRIELYDRKHLPLTIKTSRRVEVMNDLTFPGAILLGCNMAMRRRLVERIGGFDARFGAGGAMRAGEDADFVLRAHRAGCRVVYFPRILVFHHHKRTTTAQGDALKRNYHFSDGAFLTKFWLGGDRLAARWFRWRLSRLLSELLRARGSLHEMRREAGFLGSFLAGSLRFLGSPVLDRRRRGAAGRG